MLYRGGVKYVDYLGPKYGKEKDYIFKKVDIFIFPTYNETFGLVNLEAMQYKLPIITTDEGGIPDIVINNKNGFICKRKDIDSLANEIEKLINNKDLRVSLGENGYKVFKEKFTKEKFEENIYKIIKSNTNVL